MNFIKKSSTFTLYSSCVHFMTYNQNGEEVKVEEKSEQAGSDSAMTLYDSAVTPLF